MTEPVVECGRMHRSTLQTSLLAMALAALAGCTGTDTELTESATTHLNMTSSHPSNPEAALLAAARSAATTIQAPLIDAEAPVDFQTATFALG
ncbi:MAG: hypothetical protein ACI89X_001170 [Planctomycetota bacterium]|jgi:predicted component of type VI protein secretion system